MKSVKLIWLLLFTVIMMVTMKVQWNWNNKNVQHGIIKLELATTQSDAKNIIEDWNLNGAIANTYLDFLFIIAYSWFLFAAVYRTGNRLNGWGNYLKFIAFLAPLAGILDIVENYKMLQFMRDTNNFHTAYFVSAIKWGIVTGLFTLFIVLSCLVNDQEREKFI
jgi:hypothetical protein